MSNSHIHTPCDGRGPRRVYLDGRLLKYAVYADTERGEVRVLDDPPQIDRQNECLIEHTRHGVVTVEPIA